MRSALTLAVLACACADASRAVPYVDGPLELAVRRPESGDRVARDRVSAWGSVGTGRATLRVNGRPIAVAPNGAFVASLPLPGGPAPVLEFQVRVDGGEVSRRIRLIRAAASSPPKPRAATGWAMIRRVDADPDSGDVRRPVAARESPDGRFVMFLPVGARLPMAERTQDAIRLQLSKELRVWVSALEVDTLAPARPSPGVIGPADSTMRDGLIEVSVPAPEPLASTVQMNGRQLRWSIFGAPTERTDLTLRLAGSPLGWRTRWAGGRLMLQIRPPRQETGLAGLVVALDPGHPPAGTIGPTGLREDSVTLEVARSAARLLEELGARPLVVRPGPGRVSLPLRIAAAESADAHVYVSIHLDAPSADEDPWQADGTRTFYHHPSSRPLAEAMHEAVARAMDQPRRGVKHSNLVVLRPAWFPAVLIEGTCLALPEREALLRTRRGVESYAEGIVRGLSRWASEATCPEPTACR